MKMWTNLGRAFFLLFEYPIAVICQIVCLATAVKGITMATHWGDVERLVVYQTMQEFYPAGGVEALGIVLALVGLITFVGYFFFTEKVVFAGTYSILGYWLSVTALYLIVGAYAPMLFYAGLIAAILLYCVIYMTLHRNRKISPYKALTQHRPSTRLRTDRT